MNNLHKGAVGPRPKMNSPEFGVLWVEKFRLLGLQGRPALHSPILLNDCPSLNHSLAQKSV